MGRPWEAAKAAEVLTPEREKELVRSWQDKGCKRSLDALVMSHLRLAYREARKWARLGGASRYPNGADDLIGEAALALMKAADKFDTSMDVRFSTYAMIWIDSFLRTQVISDYSVIKIATTPAHKTMFFRLRRVMAQIPPIDPETGENRSHQDIVRLAADALKLPHEAVILFDTRLSGGTSMDTRVAGNEDDDDFGLHGLLADESDGAEEILAKSNLGAVASKIIADILPGLSPRDADILRRRRLLEKPDTLEVIAQDYGISRERVRQLEVVAVKRVKDALARRGVTKAILG